MAWRHAIYNCVFPRLPESSRKKISWFKQVISVIETYVKAISLISVADMFERL